MELVVRSVSTLGFEQCDTGRGKGGLYMEAWSAYTSALQTEQNELEGVRQRPCSAQGTVCVSCNIFHRELSIHITLAVALNSFVQPL